MGSTITRQEALRLYAAEGAQLTQLYARASDLRRQYHKDQAHLCAIVNAKSGNCPEDCRFCGQSSHHATSVSTYPLISVKEMLEAARRAARNKTHCFSIVISGRGVSDAELDTICEAIHSICSELPVEPCASLGALTSARIRRLKVAGLRRYHHNLETSRNFFPKICSTHTYDERVQTVRLVKAAGLTVCCGGIFGLGESREDRVDLAFALKELDVDSVPLNFLIPIKGTPLEGAQPLGTEGILKTVAIYRLILPDKEIKVSGGREFHLKDQQRRIFEAGADGFLIGNYLTTAGQDPALDLQMVQEAGLDV